MLLDLNISFPDAGEKEEHWHVKGIHNIIKTVINIHPGIDSGVWNNLEIVGVVGTVYRGSVEDQNPPGQNYLDNFNIRPS